MKKNYTKHETMSNHYDSIISSLKISLGEFGKMKKFIAPLLEYYVDNNLVDVGTLAEQSTYVNRMMHDLEMTVGRLEMQKNHISIPFHGPAKD